MKVTYKHYRIHKAPWNEKMPLKGRPLPEYLAYYPTRKTRKEQRQRWSPFPKGGKTVCEIVLDDGRTFMGVAHCSMADNFCYRLGRKIAYGRAKAKMSETAQLSFGFL